MENGLISEEAAEKLFGGLTDEEIIAQIKDNEDDIAMYYLISKYRKFVRAKARSYFLIGADKEDIIQEGMIGLYCTRQFVISAWISRHPFMPLRNCVLIDRLLQLLRLLLGRSIFLLIPMCP